MSVRFNAQAVFRCGIFDLCRLLYPVKSMKFGEERGAGCVLMVKIVILGGLRGFGMIIMCRSFISDHEIV